MFFDNARDVEQVKALIPPRTCFLMSTSRLSFPNDLRALAPQEAQHFLLKVAPRIREEAPAIAHLCAYLPQALRLAATALRQRSDLSPSFYRERLQDEQSQPKMLAAPNHAIEAVIGLSYALLDSATQRRWRMLGVFQESFDAPAAAAVWRTEKASAENTLSVLTQYALVEQDALSGRYRQQEVTRDFASRVERGEGNEAEPFHAEYYLEVLQNADDLYLDGGELLQRGLALVDLERGNIEAGQAWAASHASSDYKAAALCSGYPNAGAHCLALRQSVSERIRWREEALAAAKSLKDRGAERAHLGSLAFAYRDIGEYRRAIGYYEQHLEIARALADRRGEGQDLANLGHAHDCLGEHETAIDYYERHLQIARELEDRRREANALGCIGTAYHALGEYLRALQYHELALLAYQDIGDGRGQSIALGNLGIAHYRLGQHGRAIEFYEKQLQIANRTGDRHGEGNARWNLSLALDELGQRPHAVNQAEAALKIREEIGDPNAEKVRRRLEEWRREGAFDSSQ